MSAMNHSTGTLNHLMMLRYVYREEKWTLLIGMLLLTTTCPEINVTTVNVSTLRNNEMAGYNSVS